MKTIKIRIPTSLYDRICLARDCFELTINVIARVSARKALREGQNVAKLKKEYKSTFKGKIADKFLNIEMCDHIPYDASELRAIIWKRLDSIDIVRPSRYIPEDEGDYIIEEAVL